MASKAKLTTRSQVTTSVTSDNLGKGTELTFAEMDSNLINLRDQTIGIVADDSSTINIGAGDNLYIQGGTNVTTATNSDGSVTINSTASASGLGDLTASGSSITSPSNADFTINSSGTGNVIIEKLIIRDGPSSANSITTESGYGLNLTATNGNMSLTANAISMSSSLHVGLGGVDSGGILIEDNTIKTARSNENLEIAPAGTGSLHVQTSLAVTGASTLDGVTITDNTISTNASNANLEINANGSGEVVLENLNVAGSGATVTGIADEDAMGSNSAVKLATQQSIKAYADTKSVLTGSTNNTITTVTGANALQGEANLTFDGSTLAVTGAATVSTTLGVTGASTLDGVLISDNHISSAASNADLHIDTSGTGNIISNAPIVGIGDGATTATGGGNIILTDQADGHFQTSADGKVGMLDPSGLQIDSAGSWHYTQIALNSFSTNGYNSLWSTRSRDNNHGVNEYLEAGDTIFNFFAAGWNGDTDGTGYYSANAQVDMFASEQHDINNRGGGINMRTINTGATSGATIKFEMTDNVVIRNPKAATTAALAVEGSIRLKNTSNPSNVTDSAHIFAKDDGSTSEVYVRDEAGNETKISPHNQSGEWEYYSKNVNTGKVFRVNMESLIKEVERLSGKTFIEQE